MRVFALTKRILRQIVRDKRTMGLTHCCTDSRVNNASLCFNGMKNIRRKSASSMSLMQIVEQMDVEWCKYHDLQ